MSLLFNVAEARKSDDKAIIASISKLSNILAERRMNDPNFDIEEVYQKILGDDSIFSNAKNIKEPLMLNDVLIAIPGVSPMTSGSIRSDGNHVIPMVKLPGKSPYQAYVPGTETYEDSGKITLRNSRGVHIHRVIPDMEVSFHHYTTKRGESKRVKIDVVKLYYYNGELKMKRLEESAGVFPIPAIEDIERDSVI